LALKVIHHFPALDAPGHHVVTTLLFQVCDRILQDKADIHFKKETRWTHGNGLFKKIKMEFKVYIYDHEQAHNAG
jgi:hypothetical protein